MIDERVVPGSTDTGNLIKHIARYNFALAFARGKILDAGCGVGYGSKILSMVGDVEGCDIDLESIQEIDSPNFFQHDLVEPLSSKYDTIVCFEVLEHIENIDLAVHNLKEALNPGGKLIFSLPLYEEYGFNPYHHHTFTFEQAKDLMKIKGWNVQEGLNFYPVNLGKKFTYFIGISENNG
jgi:SAM-dependent methyltransferase